MPTCAAAVLEVMACNSESVLKVCMPGVATTLPT